MRFIVRHRAAFVAANAVWCAVVSLIAAYFTSNPNWAWNIPLGLVVGGFVGWISWTGFRALDRRAKRKAHQELRDGYWPKGEARDG